MKQVLGQLNDMVRTLDSEIDAPERRELLKQFRQLLDQADKLNAEESSIRESRTISEQIQRPNDHKLAGRQLVVQLPRYPGHKHYSRRRAMPHMPEIDIACYLPSASALSNN